MEQKSHESCHCNLFVYSHYGRYVIDKMCAENMTHKDASGAGSWARFGKYFFTDFTELATKFLYRNNQWFYEQFHIRSTPLGEIS